MKVIICGAGQVGLSIARQLASEENDVVIIDQSEALVRRVSDMLDVAGVVGFASRPDVLLEAGARDADVIIAVTYSDEVNMIACQVAHSVFNVPRKMARVRAQSYLEAQWQDMFRRDHMPIDVIISPEIEVAASVLRRLGAPGAFESTPFMDNQVQLLGTRLTADCALLHTPLKQITQLFPSVRSKVVGFERNGRLSTPGPEDQLLEGDNVFVIAANEYVERTLELLGHEEKRARRVLIAGGGNVGFAVAEALERDGVVKAKLIEKDRKRAEFVAERLKRTIVLHGDVLDASILSEANVAETDVIVALTDDDKANLLVGVLAKQEGCGSSMALLNNQNLLRLVAPMEIDAFVNPRATTVSSILRHVRRTRVRALHSVRDGAGEVIEAQVLQTSALSGKSIDAVDFPAGAIVGAIRSGGEMVAPVPNYVFKDGDIVIIFAVRDAVSKVHDLLRVSHDYIGSTVSKPRRPEGAST